MTTDVVVIGSGPCGAIAAHELIEAGLDVTLLEAGRRAPGGVLLRVGGNTVFRWVSEPMRTDRHTAGGDPSTTWYSSLSLGGLSNYWTAAVPRMHPRDFDDGAALDERFRWPVTYDDLAPAYTHVERLMGVTAGEPIDGVPRGEVRFHRALPPDWRELGAAMGSHGFPVGAVPMATGSPTMAARRPTGWNSYHCIVKPLLARPGLHLLTGARALRIEHDATAGAARSVEYLDEATGEVRRIPCRAVVVAAGALDTTRLLLQSRSSDFPDGLGNAHGLVGRYLHDHPREWWPATFDRPLRLLAHPAYIARPAYGDLDPLMACSHTIGMVGATTRIKAWAHGRSTRAGVQVFGTMVPQEDHTVTLERFADPVAEAMAPLQLVTSYDDQARRNMLAARRRFVEAFAAAGV